jgi:hypothetical protein
MSRSQQTHHSQTRPPVGGPGLLYSLTAADLIVGGSRSLGRTAEEIAYVDKLRVIISASPDRPTRSKPELVQIGTTSFHLSKRRAGALREQLIYELGATAWSTAGRRPRS